MKKTGSSSFERVSKYKAKLIFGKQFKIKRLSADEICLLTKERFLTNNCYRIELKSLSDEKIKPLAEVVSSFLKELEKGKDNISPIYEVSLKFNQMDEMESKFIKKLICEFIKRAKKIKEFKTERTANKTCAASADV
jgi:hypothetical protein